MLYRNHSFYHIFDLNGQFSGRTQDQAYNFVEDKLLSEGFTLILSFILSSLNFLDAQIEHGNSETQGLSLSSSGGNYHIEV